MGNQPHTYLSAYLSSSPQPVRPAYSWRPLLNRLFVLKDALIRTPRQRWLVIAVWIAITSTGLNLLYADRSIPGSNTVLSTGITAPETKTATLATAKKAPVLPAGPTGQLLPPGTMAPPYTYANSYSRGQCTWYAAGRRPIPNNWGHARTWLSSARAAGWATGSTPAVAAIAWTSAGYYGHVALVEAVDTNTGQVLVSEMNYFGPYYTNKRWVDAGAFKYIY